MMPIDWQTFKSSLGPSNNISIFYIDDEGSEIPIESEPEFQEALKFAQLHRDNQFQVILKLKNSENDNVIGNLKEMEKGMKNDCKKSDTRDRISDERKSARKSNKLVDKSQSMKNALNSDDGPPPLWFAYHLTKFKKKLMEEIKGSINEAVHNAFKKEIKTLKGKGESSEKLLIQSQGSVECKSKSTLRDEAEMSWEQREWKLLKKFEKFHLTKLQKLESRLDKLNSKTRLLIEDRRSQRHHKRKAQKKLLDSTVKSNDLGKPKSAFFMSTNVKMEFQPDEQLLLPITVENDGMLPWKAPKMVCHTMEGITLNQESFYFKPTLPNGKHILTLKGKVSHQPGVYELKCRMYDGQEELCDPFVYTIEVAHIENESENVTSASNIIVNCQRKIEENINEIEKRLQSISFHPSISVLPETGKLETKQSEFIDIKEEKPAEKPKSFVYSLAEEAINFNQEIESTPDLLQLAEGKDSLPENSFEKVKDSSSDSEISVLCISEEEDNFIVVPLPEKTATPSQENVKEETVMNLAQSEIEPSAPPDQLIFSLLHEPITTATAATMTSSPDVVNKSDGSANELQKKSLNNGRAMKKLKKTVGSQCVPGRSRSPFSFDMDTCKAKKLRSSTMNPFAGANTSHSSLHGSPERKTPEKSDSSAFTEGKRKWMNDVEQSKSENENKRTDRIEKEVFYANSQEPVGDAAVNILPGVLMNGATNMASLAISTAKSVISNLQSAFVPEGMIDHNRLRLDERKGKKPSMEALCSLFEMGFRDLETNKRLLLTHSNDLSKVIEELVANATENSNQP